MTYFIFLYISIFFSPVSISFFPFWAAAPIGDKVLWNGEIFRLFIHPYVRPSFRPSVRTYVRPPLEGPRASHAGLRPSQLGLRASQAGLRASQTGLRASQPALRPDWQALRPAWLTFGLSRGGMDGQMDGWMDGQADGWMENLPIPQDFVPYWGCCPATV